VNRCPYTVTIRTGWLYADRWQRGSNPNYFPNSFDNIKPDESYKNVPPPTEGINYCRFSRNGEGEMIIIPNQKFYRQVLTISKKALVKNITGAMNGIAGPKKME
jgi:catalase